MESDPDSIVPARVVREDLLRAVLAYLGDPDAATIAGRDLPRRIEGRLRAGGAK